MAGTLTLHRPLQGDREQSRSLSWPAVPLMIAALVAFEVVMGIIYLASVHYPETRFFADTGRFWDMDGEANLPAWFSSIQLWVVATVVGAIAWREFNKRSLGSWSLVAATLLFVFLSADEGAMLHERLGVAVDRLLVHRDDSIFSKTGLWMIVLGPILALAGILLAYGAWGYLKRDMRATVVGTIGLAVFFGSAVGLEMLSNFVTPETTMAYMQIVTEEVGEMIGITLTLWAACMLARTLGVRLADAPDAPPQQETSPKETRPDRVTRVHLSHH